MKYCFDQEVCNLHHTNTDTRTHTHTDTNMHTDMHARARGHTHRHTNRHTHRHKHTYRENRCLVTPARSIQQSRMVSDRFENNIERDLLLSSNRCFGGLCCSCHDLKLRAKSYSDGNITTASGEVVSVPYSWLTS